MKRYAYGWITLAFFVISMVGHWLFGWLAFVDDARDHGAAPELTPYLMVMGRDTYENRQSEFLQLLWQVLGLAYFLYVGSPASKQNDDRTEAKLDALLQLVGKNAVRLLSVRSTRPTSVVAVMPEFMPIPRSSRKG